MSQETLATSNASDATVKRGRVVRRLLPHLETGFLLLLVLAVWTLMAVPGEIAGVAATTGASVHRYEHGWPLVHLCRLDAQVWHNWHPSITSYAESTVDDWSKQEADRPWPIWATAPKRRSLEDSDLTQWDYSDGEPVWLLGEKWQQRGTKVIVDKTALVLNLSTAVLMCLAVVGPYQWWRRRECGSRCDGAC